VLVARYKSDRVEHSLHEAVGLLERLLKAAEEGGRTGSVIEILLLQALAHEAQGDIPHAPAPLERALVPLERALALAEPEGYVRIFVDEGLPMARLLSEVAAHSIMPDYAGKLLAAFETTDNADASIRRPTTDRGSTLSSVVHHPSSGLVEPLSERELTVLKLLRTELNGPEIARELVVSLNTMRTHTKNIYSKLGVNNRRAAVRRAEELDLF